MGFPERLYGHEGAVAQIGRLLEGGRFPHALLIHGPKGIGKRLLAENLAWRLICGPSGEAGEGAGLFGDAVPAASPIGFDREGAQAAQLDAGSCPDLHIIEPEKGKKSIGIARVRDLLSELLRSADTGRVVIVDALEDMTPEAANTLLKTLEEPRPGITFLLVCHQLSLVLPTIRSRCRLLRVHPLSRDEVRMVLNEKGEDTDLAAMAHGSPGMVLDETAKARRTLVENLNRYLQGGEVPALGNNAGLIPDALMEVLAGHSAAPEVSGAVGGPSLRAARQYREIATLAQAAGEYNLPAALVAEVILGMVKQDKPGAH